MEGDGIPRVQAHRGTRQTGGDGSWHARSLSSDLLFTIQTLWIDREHAGDLVSRIFVIFLHFVVEASSYYHLSSQFISTIPAAIVDRYRHRAQLETFSRAESP